ncbi:MAG: hypothetical protein GW802_24815 [Armatimonadetes bacterium]|nr:hypothetical protein [Armatimonadota bacterium]
MRTHDYGDRLFQTSRGIRKGAWTRLAMPFGEFFGWSFRRFGSLRVKQFEITSVGTRRIGLDDVEITVEPGAAEAVARVPNMLFLPGRDATGAPGGTWSYYRRQKDWAEFACRRLFDLGFNSLAGGDEALEPHRRRTMPYFAGPGLTWAGPRLQDSKGNTALFPDVFDPEWQKGAEEWVRETTDKHRDDPLLLGYFTDNEIQMHQPLSRSIGIMDYFWSPSTAQELVRWLHERYKGEVEALNRRWSSAHHRYQYKRFDDLPADKPTRRGDDDPVGEDLRDFVRHMVKTYADTIVGLYRKHDPNHLVCSNRFAGQFDVGFADLLRPYDLIACNSYPRSRWGQTELSSTKGSFSGCGRCTRRPAGRSSSPSGACRPPTPVCPTTGAASTRRRSAPRRTATCSGSSGARSTLSGRTGSRGWTQPTPKRRTGVSWMPTTDPTARWQARCARSTPTAVSAFASGGVDNLCWTPEQVRAPT